MNRALVAFFCGLLFGAGLIVSQMSNPAKVIAFLDISGQWDPSLALVMAGAVGVFALGYRLALRRGASSFGGAFSLPRTGRGKRRGNGPKAGGIHVAKIYPR